MIDREQLVAWASTLPDDFVKCAVRDADREANDNVEGDDEHAAFYDALFASLGGKRPMGRPKDDRLSLRELTAFVRMRGDDFSETALKKVLSREIGISESTARSRIIEAKRQRDANRARFAVLLAGPVAEHGRAMMAEALAKR